jgi:hypothetical protein
MGDTHVASYTRNGRTVRAHTREVPDGYGPGDEPEEDPAAQRRRERFEKRVNRERTGQRTPAEKKQKRSPGERKPRKKSPGQKARQHWRKARRTSKKRGWRRAYHHAAAGFWGAAATGRWIGRKLRGEWS